MTEADIIAGKLDGYKLVVLVGDHWAEGTVPALEKWVKAGGVALGDGRLGPARQLRRPPRPSGTRWRG